MFMFAYVHYLQGRNVSLQTIWYLYIEIILKIITVIVTKKQFFSNSM